ncbi:MAG: WbqC family protein [Muribaculaceae bacterium]|nr:WbqC family protein [Muribaculaceae bacterium]
MPALIHSTPIVMGSMCAGSVRCYAAMVAAGRVIIDPGERHLPLRHSHHRYAIVGPNGVQQLTVPLTGNTHNMATPIDQVRISEHGDWRHLHWGALYSAYGRTPYFDYIADDLHALLVDGGQTSLLQLNLSIHRLVVDFMDLPLTTIVSTETPPDAVDLRGRIGGKRPDSLPLADVPYYQLWADRHGFRPGLSILDLLMNTGREGIFTLMQMAQG